MTDDSTGAEALFRALFTAPHTAHSWSSTAEPRPRPVVLALTVVAPGRHVYVVYVGGHRVCSRRRKCNAERIARRLGGTVSMEGPRRRVVRMPVEIVGTRTEPDGSYTVLFR